MFVVHVSETRRRHWSTTEIVGVYPTQELAHRGLLKYLAVNNFIFYNSTCDAYESSYESEDPSPTYNTLVCEECMSLKYEKITEFLLRSVESAESESKESIGTFITRASKQCRKFYYGIKRMSMTNDVVF